MKTRRRYRTHRQPKFLKTKPFYLVKIPWPATSGEPTCPAQYYNGLEAAVQSLLTAMRCDEMHDVQWWMKNARRQLAGAIRQSEKPGAAVPVEGQRFARD